LRVRSASSASSIYASSWSQDLWLSVVNAGATSGNVLQQLQPGYVIAVGLHLCCVDDNHVIT